jgi:hypothetical protein
MSVVPCQARIITVDDDGPADSIDTGDAPIKETGAAPATEADGETITDITGEGALDFEDMVVLTSQWMQTPGIPSGDIAPEPNGDGAVNFLDFARLAEDWTSWLGVAEIYAARDAADAGIRRALYEMNRTFVFGVGPGPLPPDVVDEPLDNSYARYSYHVDGPLMDPATDEDYWLITSTGEAGQKVRTVYAMTTITNLFDYALIVTDTITLHEGSLLDGYNSLFGYPSPPATYDLKIGTTSILENRIDLKNNVVVDGDVLIGIGGDLDVVIKETPEGGATTGLRYALPTPHVFEEITPPTNYDAPPLSLVGSSLLITAPLGYTMDIPYKVVAPQVNIGEGGRRTPRDGRYHIWPRCGPVRGRSVGATR